MQYADVELILQSTVKANTIDEYDEVSGANLFW